MKVLVIGARGYLGSALVPYLRAAGHEVVGVGRGDLIPEAPYYALIHLAGGGGPAACAADPIKAIRDNVLSLNLADSINAPRRILASSLYVYPPADRAMCETSATGPETVYGACKEAAEAAWYGTALRIAHVYGSSPKPHGDVVTAFCRAAALGGEVTINGHGTRRIDLLHIDDACAAFLAAIRAPALPPVINVGSPAPITIRRIAELAGLVPVAAVIGEDAVGVNGRYALAASPGAADTPDRWLDCTLAREVLGWRAQIVPEIGIPAFVKALREGGS